MARRHATAATVAVIACFIAASMLCPRSSVRCVETNAIKPQSLTITRPADITYTAQQTGNNIVWIVTGSLIEPRQYTVCRDATAVAAGVWNPGERVTVNVDGLYAGTYNYTITATSGDGGAIEDTVFVTANPDYVLLSLLVLIMVGTIGIICYWSTRMMGMKRAKSNWIRNWKNKQRSKWKPPKKSDSEVLYRRGDESIHLE
jgi:hypothetical protein